MFGLREGNGREEKKNKGNGKMHAQVIGFLTNLAHFYFLQCYPNSGKDLISLSFSSLPLKPNVVLLLTQIYDGSHIDHHVGGLWHGST